MDVLVDSVSLERPNVSGNVVKSWVSGWRGYRVAAMRTHRELETSHLARAPGPICHPLRVKFPGVSRSTPGANR
jgi:hypothetical protein